MENQLEVIHRNREMAEAARSDFLRRVEEIKRLELEPQIDAWECFSTIGNFASTALALGITERYLARLIAREYRDRAIGGANFSDLITFLGDLEPSCWKFAVQTTSEGDLSVLNFRRSIALGHRDFALMQSGQTLDALVLLLDDSLTEIRARIILSQVVEGATLAEMSKVFGLSRERVRQILDRHFGFDLRHFRNTNREQILRTKSELSDRIAKWITDHPGCTLEEIGEGVQLSTELAKSLIPRRSRHLVMRSSVQPQSTTCGDREIILAALRWAHDALNPLSSMYSSPTITPLTSTRYDRLRKDGLQGSLSSARISQIFGSWSNACLEAGILPTHSQRTHYERRWTAAQLRECVANYLMETQHSSIADYDLWANRAAGRPRWGTIRNQLEPKWPDVVFEGLKVLRTRWAVNQN